MRELWARRSAASPPRLTPLCVGFVFVFAFVFVFVFVFVCVCVVCCVRVCAWVAGTVFREIALNIGGGQVWSTSLQSACLVSWL